MSPARVDDASPVMDSSIRKRPAEIENGAPPAKKQKTIPPTAILAVDGAESSSVSKSKTADTLASDGLRRGIALVLQKVGFESASADAMEEFISMTDKYMTSFVEHVKMLANTARRAHPIPTDFGHTLAHFNLSTSMLDPHRKPPIRRSKRLPVWQAVELNDPIESDLPILSDDLNGIPDKQAKHYIPNSFPAFPSTHTYKYTPESIDAVTVLKEPPPPTAESASQSFTASQKQQIVEWPLAPDEIPRGDPKKMREAAAKEAKAAEVALRKLMRASKVASQKESWMSAQREPAKRERFELWESAMRELIEEDARSKGQELAPAEMHGEKGREGIADYSMIVNSERSHYRREVVRPGGRKTSHAIETISGKV